MDRAGAPHVDELTRKLVVNAFAQFCAEQGTRPDASSARRFALEVTESGARAYHGLDGDHLERLLARELRARDGA